MVMMGELRLLEEMCWCGRFGWEMEGKHSAYGEVLGLVLISPGALWYLLLLPPLRNEFRFDLVVLVTLLWEKLSR